MAFDVSKLTKARAAGRGGRGGRAGGRGPKDSAKDDKSTKDGKQRGKSKRHWAAADEEETQLDFSDAGRPPLIKLKCPGLGVHALQNQRVLDPSAALQGQRVNVFGFAFCTQVSICSESQAFQGKRHPDGLLFTLTPSHVVPAAVAADAPGSADDGGVVASNGQSRMDVEDEEDLEIEIDEEEAIASTSGGDAGGQPSEDGAAPKVRKFAVYRSV